MTPAVRFAFVCLAAAALVAFGGHRVDGPRASLGEADSADDAEEADGADDADDPPLETDEAVDDRAFDEGAEDLASNDAIAADDESSALAESPDGGKKRRRARGGCPSNMVRVRDYCIDRYEAPNRRGARPLAMQSANDAVAWCSEHHKRICTEDEWIIACEGEEQRAYPYGSEHVDGRCNDDKPWRKVDEATLAKWPAPEAHAHARDLYQATPSGWKHKCASDTGVRDLTGNVEEWVARTRDHANDYAYLLIGCYWSGCYGGNKPTCHSTNNAHGPEFRFYETGFRCCRDAAQAKP